MVHLQTSDQDLDWVTENFTLPITSALLAHKVKTMLVKSPKLICMLEKLVTWSIRGINILHMKIYKIIGYSNGHLIKSVIHSV